MNVDAVADDQPRRPSLLHYVAAWGTIYVGLQISACLLDFFLVDRNPMALIGLIGLVPFVGPLLWCQYRGTFRGIANCAAVAGRLLYGLGLFILFGYVSNVAEAVDKHGRPPLQAMYDLWGLGVAALPILAAARSNQLRARSLRASSTRVHAQHLHRPTSQRQLLGELALISIVIAVTMYQHQVRGPRSAEHLNRADVPFAVPAEATDVSYGRSAFSTLAYEFTIDEPGFRAWVTQHFEKSDAPGRKLIEIKDVTTFGRECSISRYTSLIPDPAGDHDAKVSDGLCFERHFEDQRRQTVYNRVNQRAYFYVYGR